MHILVDLLDTKTRRDWEESLGRTSDPPSYQQFRNFLQEQLLTHKALRSTKGDASAAKPPE